MPTGYTAAVADGKITTLREFALLCARGMGALITMRDAPLDAPIPEKLEPNFAYYGPELEKAKALLAELPTISAEECERRAQAEYEQVLRWRREANARSAEQLQRYDAMIAAVEAWECQAEGLKEFMLQQLRDSRQFDCRHDYMDDAPKAPPSGTEWREKAVAEAIRKIGRMSEEVAKEEHRTASRNAWLKARRASLRETEGVAQ